MLATVINAACGGGQLCIGMHLCLLTYLLSTSLLLMMMMLLAAYHNISNIILHISRQGSTQQPAVLLVAHHDSPVGSPGEHPSLVVLVATNPVLVMMPAMWFSR
jgi:hypothetical protein